MHVGADIKGQVVNIALYHRSYILRSTSMPVLQRAVECVFSFALPHLSASLFDGSGPSHTVTMIRQHEVIVKSYVFVAHINH